MRLPDQFFAIPVKVGSGDPRVYPPAGAILCMKSADVHASAVPSLRDWTYCADAMPSEPDRGIMFEDLAYLVTDGHTTGVCSWQRGHGCGTPWAAWSTYGDIRPENIIAWIAFPKPAARRPMVTVSDHVQVEVDLTPVPELGNYRECPQSKAEREQTAGEAIENLGRSREFRNEQSKREQHHPANSLDWIDKL